MCVPFTLHELFMSHASYSAARLEALSYLQLRSHRNCWTSSSRNFQSPLPFREPSLMACNCGCRRPDAWSRTQPLFTPSHVATSPTPSRRLGCWNKQVTLSRCGARLAWRLDSSTTLRCAYTKPSFLSKLWDPIQERLSSRNFLLFQNGNFFILASTKNSFLSTWFLGIVVCLSGIARSRYFQSRYFQLWVSIPDPSHQKGEREKYVVTAA